MTQPSRHILMILDQDFPPDLRVENEARTLCAAGYEVTILAIAPDTRPKEEWLGPIRIVRERIPAQLRNKMRGLAGTIPLLHLFVRSRVRRIHTRYPVHALHAHDLYLFGPALVAGRSLGIPVIGDMHENWVEALRSYAWSTKAPGKWVVRPERWQVLEDRWSREVDHLVVVIEEMAERLVARGVDSDHITVIPNTVRLEEFDAWPVAPVDIGQENHRILLYTGGMDRHRGLEHLIDAMPSLVARHPDVRLVLVGDGATRGELEERAARSGVAEAILFTGWQPQERVKSFMAAASVGLIPHLKTAHTDHTIPHKLFHYMVMRLPVVASDCRPLVRILRDACSGSTYASGSAEELSDAVSALLADGESAREMGNRGHDAVRDRYHWDATARPLVQVYNRVLRRL